MSALADLAAVPAGLVSEFWPRVASRLRAAYLRTDLSHTDDLAADVLFGRALLWVAMRGEAIEAAAVTKLGRTDRHLVCTITACGGGNMAGWLDHLAVIEHWARGEGCAKVRIFGRKGWLRKLKDYHVSNVVLERGL